jgi:hypothetical protein
MTPAILSVGGMDGRARRAVTVNARWHDGRVAETDYVEWHASYDDPNSGLSWRLGMVQGYLRRAFGDQKGPIRILSVCSGDGRDVLGVLAGRADGDRFAVTLLEVHPQLAQSARDAAKAAGLANIEVRTVDAGTSDAYVGAVPADVVLLVGIFGNISVDDIWRTIAAAPQLCRTGATLIWSRSRDRDDLNNEIRAAFAEAGFTELDYAALERESRPALGVMRYDGEAVELGFLGRLFTFRR